MCCLYVPSKFRFLENLILFLNLPSPSLTFRLDHFYRLINLSSASLTFRRPFAFFGIRSCSSIFFFLFVEFFSFFLFVFCSSAPTYYFFSSTFLIAWLLVISPQFRHVISTNNKQNQQLITEFCFPRSKNHISYVFCRQIVSMDSNGSTSSITRILTSKTLQKFLAQSQTCCHASKPVVVFNHWLTLKLIDNLYIYSYLPCIKKILKEFYR